MQNRQLIFFVSFLSTTNAFYWDFDRNKRSLKGRKSKTRSTEIDRCEQQSCTDVTARFTRNSLRHIRYYIFDSIANVPRTFDVHIIYFRFRSGHAPFPTPVLFYYSFGYFFLFSDPYTYNDTRALRLIITTEPTFSSAYGKREEGKEFIYACTHTHTHMLHNASVYLRPYIINARVRTSCLENRVRSEIRWGRCAFRAGRTGRDEITIVLEWRRGKIGSATGR